MDESRPLGRMGERREGGGGGCLFRNVAEGARSLRAPQLEAAVQAGRVPQHVGQLTGDGFDAPLAAVLAEPRSRP